MFTTPNLLENNSNNECSSLKSFDPNKPVKVTIIIDEDDTQDPSGQEIHGKNMKKKSPRRRNIIKATEFRNNTSPENSFIQQTVDSSDKRLEYNYVPTYARQHIPVMTPTRRVLNNNTVIHPLDFIINNIVDIFKYFFSKPVSVQNEQDYQKYKLSKFNQCYHVVVKFLIPIEHNETFINNFLMRLTTVVKNHSLPVVHNQTKYILIEMMSWCKKRSLFPPPPYNANNANATFTTIPTNYFPTIPYNTPVNNNRTISEAHKNPFVVSLCKEVNVCENQHFINNFNYNTNKEKFSGNDNVAFRKTLITPSSTYFPQTPTSQENVNEPNPVLISLLEQDVRFCANSNVTNDVYNETGKECHDENENVMHIDASRIPNSLSVPETPLRLGSVYESSDYSITDSMLNPDNMTECNGDRTLNINQPYINQQAEDKRCTISRDSGIMSPTISYYFLDDAIMNKEEELTQERNGNDEISPSTNNVNNVKKNYKIGSCSTCKTATHLMCKGCSKIYYCSIECMKAEWQLHKFFCEYR